MCSRKKAAVVEEILHWLDMNYELSEGVCIPRCLLYQHYLDSCRLKQCPPIGAAAFGKMVRRKFNQISTRRLGTRGQSKYHYYGLSVRPDSRYYGSSIEADLDENRSLPSFSVFKSKITSCSTPDIESAVGTPDPPKTIKGCRKKLNNEVCDKSLESRIEAAVFIMKSFPRSCDLLHVPSNIDSYELDTFLLMYKTHCERLLDSFLCDQLDDVHLYIKHFWTQIPSHFQQLLSTSSESGSFLSNGFISSVIETCDYLFYEALETGLFPEDLNAVSEQLVSTLTFLSVNFDCWIRECISNVLPLNLVQVKMKALDDFLKCVRRHLSLIPLVKSCNLIVGQKMVTERMSNDLKNVDLFNVIEEDIGLFDASAVRHVRHLIEFIAHTFSGSGDGSCQADVQLVSVLNNLIQLIRGTVQEFVRNEFQDYDGQVKTSVEMTNTPLALQFQSFSLPSSSSSTRNEECLISRGVVILLTIGRAISSLSRELTLSNSSSFGYWHLIFLLVNDYSLITFESMIRKQTYFSKRAAVLNTPSASQCLQFSHQISINSSTNHGNSSTNGYSYKDHGQGFAVQKQSEDFDEDIKEFIQL